MGLFPFWPSPFCGFLVLLSSARVVILWTANTGPILKGQYWVGMREEGRARGPNSLSQDLPFILYPRSPGADDWKFPLPSSDTPIANPLPQTPRHMDTGQPSIREKFNVS